MVLNAQMAHKQRDKETPESSVQTASSAGTAKKADFRALLKAVGDKKDKDAFVQIFEYFAPRIKSFLMKSGASPEQADELAQETMLTIWNKAKSYKPEAAAPSTWIFTIARNKRIDSLRKVKHYIVDDADPLLIEDETPGPRHDTLQNEEADIMAEALKKLPEEQAELIKKSFFEDKSHVEIAKETGIPLGTVKSRIRLALQRLEKNTNIQSIR